MNYLFNNGIIKIHLKSRQGVYGVFSIGKDTITCQTKHYSFRVPKSDFKCFAGGYKPSEKQANYFKALLSESNLQKQLDVVKYKLQNELIQLKKDEADMKYQVNDYYDNLEKTFEMLQNKLVVQKKEHEKEIKEKMKETTVNSDEMRKYKFKKAVEIYQHPIDLSNFENHDGIKFIIQEDTSETEHRMFFDPFQFVSNFHSSLDEVTKIIRSKTNGDSWYTINGGWLKVIGNAVVLYARSGDYGVYDNDIAIECAKKLFPTKEIYSYADLAWDDSMPTENPGTLYSFYKGHEFAGDKFLNSSFELDDSLNMNDYDGDPYKSYYIYKKGLCKVRNKFISDMLDKMNHLCMVDDKPCYIHDGHISYLLHFYKIDKMGGEDLMPF